MSKSKLQQVLEAGNFAVTAECGPPKGSDTTEFLRDAKLMKDCSEGINITDCPSANVRMSSLGCAILLTQNGIEPVLQMTCRDRNRVALQGDLLTAAAFGIHNVLMLSGDHTSLAEVPGAKAVYDLDSVNLLQVGRKMTTEHKLMGDSEFTGDIDLFIGAVENPFADPFDFRVIRLAKKVKAGAKFIQTQCIYDMARFREFMKRVVDKGLHEKVCILAGITPLRSFGMAKFMATNVAGITIPEDILKRIKDAGKENAAAEGLKLANEQIQQMKETPGVRGIHLMAIGQEKKVPDIIKEAGLLPRPQV